MIVGSCQPGGGRPDASAAVKRFFVRSILDDYNAHALSPLLAAKIGHRSGHITSATALHYLSPPVRGKDLTATGSVDFRKVQFSRKLRLPRSKKKRRASAFVRRAACSWGPPGSGVDKVERVEVAVSVATHQVFVVRNDRVHLLVRVAKVSTEDLVVDIPVVGLVGDIA